MNINFSLSRIHIIFFVIILLIILMYGVFYVKYFSISIENNTESYQAVFLSNNQVYFGKLSKLNSQYPILSDVYYIQSFSSQDFSNADKTGKQLQLVKLGSELHQPQDVMYLNRNQILFIEPLKDDSKIIKAINGFKQNQIQ